MVWLAVRAGFFVLALGDHFNGEGSDQPRRDGGVEVFLTESAP